MHGSAVNAYKIWITWREEKFGGDGINGMIRLILKKRGVRLWTWVFGWGWSPLVGCCEGGSEPSGLMEVGSVWLGDCHLLKKDPSSGRISLHYTNYFKVLKCWEVIRKICISCHIFVACKVTWVPCCWDVCLTAVWFTAACNGRVSINITTCFVWLARTLGSWVRLPLEDGCCYAVGLAAGRPIPVQWALIRTSNIYRKLSREIKVYGAYTVVLFAR
jgi:hypothetical protein